MKGKISFDSCAGRSFAMSLLAIKYVQLLHALVEIDQWHRALWGILFSSTTAPLQIAVLFEKYIWRFCHEQIVASYASCTNGRCDVVAGHANRRSASNIPADAAKRGRVVGRGRRYRHGYGGAALGLGIAGALIGGAIIGATQPYGYYPPGYYGPVYVAPAPYVGDDAVRYCMQRFRSYDPNSGTYVGYDGLRHPCP
jgi:hypothetical protein